VVPTEGISRRCSTLRTTPIPKGGRDADSWQSVRRRPMLSRLIPHRPETPVGNSDRCFKCWRRWPNLVRRCSMEERGAHLFLRTLNTTELLRAHSGARITDSCVVPQSLADPPKRFLRKMNKRRKVTLRVVRTRLATQSRLRKVGNQRRAKCSSRKLHDDEWWQDTCVY